MNRPRLPEPRVLWIQALAPRPSGDRLAVAVLEAAGGAVVAVGVQTPAPDGGWVVAAEVRLAPGEPPALARALRATRNGRARLTPPEPPQPDADPVGEELVN